ncbi:MAG: IclR family transcriptional regulator [Rubrivivax sp.]|nr:IclR family transcriptional regulator [Rubrivivax sp.]
MDTRTRPAHGGRRQGTTDGAATARDATGATTRDGTGGTQAIERALLLLRVLASAGRRGMRVADVVAGSALPQATVSRIVASLLREGVVERDERTRNLHIGHVVHELALVARARYALPVASRQPMQWLAEQTQDTVYLSEPSGSEAVCTAREEGSYPIKALPLHVGIRRPLGVGAGGLAILAAMPAERAEAIVAANAERYPAYGGIDAAWLREAIAQARREGHATIAEKATPGMTAIGVAIATASGEPIGALSLAAISSRMPAKRRAELARLLRTQCDGIAQAVAAP